MNAGRLKILVVDDEPPIRKLLRLGLTTQGYDVLEAPNGKTSLELLAKIRIWSSSISGFLTFKDTIC
jgi:two-component system KDP operon response regulator KdpE